jgi:hypothetical protein
MILPGRDLEEKGAAAAGGERRRLRINAEY